MCFLCLNAEPLICICILCWNVWVDLRDPSDTSVKQINQWKIGENQTRWEYIHPRRLSLRSCNYLTIVTNQMRLQQFKVSTNLDVKSACLRN